MCVDCLGTPKRAALARDFTRSQSSVCLSFFVSCVGGSQVSEHGRSLFLLDRPFGPEIYLRDIFRVLPHWLPDRYLELAPKYWAATRARLDPKQLAAEIGPLTVPEPPSAEEQPAAC